MVEPWSEMTGVEVQYSLAESEKMGVAVRVSNGFGVGSEEFAGLGLGLNLIYRITPQLAVYTDCAHLSFGGADFPKPVSINLPIGFQFQANEKINAFLSTSIANIGLSPSGTVLIGRDVTPLNLGAWFSPSNMLDVGAMFSSFNLEDTADLYMISLMANYRM